jgi:uncharacterized membrane protein YeiH
MLHQLLSVLKLAAWEADRTFSIPASFDYFATFAWALSGAIVGARRGYDIVGVFIIAIGSSVGGGLLRDGFFLQRTPVILTDGNYLLLIAVATLLVGISARQILKIPRWVSLDKIVALLDAVGVPAYAVIGMQLASGRELALPGVVLVGVINGVGGGLLRDVLVSEPAHLLQPGQYSSLILLVACLGFVGATRWYAIPATSAAWVTVAFYFAVSALTIRFNWKTNALLREPATWKAR